MTKKETAESIRNKKLAEAVKSFDKKLDEAVEWIKGFAKRVPTLFDYCTQLERANIETPVYDPNWNSSDEYRDANTTEFGYFNEDHLYGIGVRKKGRPTYLISRHGDLDQYSSLAQEIGSLGTMLADAISSARFANNAISHEGDPDYCLTADKWEQSIKARKTVIEYAELAAEWEKKLIDKVDHL